MSENAFHIYGSVMAFLFIVPMARLAFFYTDKTTGQAFNWPSIGIVGVMAGYSAIRPAPTPRQRISVWLCILVAIPISYGLTFVKLPWARIAVGMAGFWIIFRYAKTAIHSAVTIVAENQEITTANFALQAALEKNAEKLRQLEAVSQQRALSFDEQRMIDALRRAQENIQSRLVEFVEDMVDGSQRPQLSLVKTDKENPAT